VGNTAAILENDDTLSREQQRRLLTDVNEDAQWLIRMVENLLSITRINDEQAKLNKDYEVVEEIVAEAVRKFEKRFPAGVKIDVEVPQDVLLVPMDATLISQVLLNLFENAVFHGGDVTQLRLSVLQEGEFACFCVSDNGCGIPKEKLPVIFEGLGSTSSSQTDMKKNMGIGLSVCRTIVKAHGGYMTAENLSGGGACFRFYLPMKETANNED
jgi:two-component system sensor histidine kinase KdpD